MTDVSEAFPPFTERPSVQEVWRRARADYLGGDPAPAVAARYGLSERSVRRRASAEGWRRCDIEVDLNEPPPWSRPRAQSRSDYVAAHPEYAEIAAARDADAFSLLFSPRQADFRRVAFRRAAEGAAMDRPSDAAAWLRVLRMLDACDPVEHSVDDIFSADDHLRAAILRAIARDDDGENDELDEDPGLCE